MATVSRQQYENEKDISLNKFNSNQLEPGYHLHKNYNCELIKYNLRFRLIQKVQQQLLIIISKKQNKTYNDAKENL